MTVRDIKRKQEPAVAVIIMGKVRSLANKTDELAALIRIQRVHFPDQSVAKPVF